MIDFTPLSADYLMKQAGYTAHDYMLKAVKSLDEKFHIGYAESHPEALIGFMQTCASDFHTCMMVQESEKLQAILSELIDTIDRRDNDGE